MWKVEYYLAAERALDHQRELELRRRLAEAARPSRRDRAGVLFVRRAAVLGGAIVNALLAALDRPLIGSHHL